MDVARSCKRSHPTSATHCHRFELPGERHPCAARAVGSVAGQKFRARPSRLVLRYEVPSAKTYRGSCHAASERVRSRGWPTPAHAASRRELRHALELRLVLEQLRQLLGVSSSGTGEYRSAAARAPRPGRNTACSNTSVPATGWSAPCGPRRRARPRGASTPCRTRGSTGAAPGSAPRTPGRRCAGRCRRGTWPTSSRVAALPVGEQLAAGGSMNSSHRWLRARARDRCRSRRTRRTRRGSRPGSPSGGRARYAGLGPRFSISRRSVGETRSAGGLHGGASSPRPSRIRCVRSAGRQPQRARRSPRAPPARRARRGPARATCTRSCPRRRAARPPRAAGRACGGGRRSGSPTSSGLMLARRVRRKSASSSRRRSPLPFSRFGRRRAAGGLEGEALGCDVYYQDKSLSCTWIRDCRTLSP